MIIKSGLLVSLTSLLPVFLVDQLATHASSNFSVYCSSNMDGTGICTKEGTTESLECIVLQGSIIGCKDSTNKFRCVQFGQIIANQAQFSCKQNEIKTETSLLEVEEKSPESQLSVPLLFNNPPSLNPFDQSQPKNDSIMDGAF